MTTDREEPADGTPSRPVRVVIVDDHTSVTEALRYALGAEADIDVVAVAASASSGEDAVRALRPDVALVDHRIGAEDGIELVRVLHHQQPGTMLLMLTATTDETTVLRALEAGCAGYLVKDTPLDAIADELPGVAVVAMSGTGDRSSREAMTRSGAVAVVDKSDPVEIMCEAVRSARRSAGARGTEQP